MTSFMHLLSPSRDLPAVRGLAWKDSYRGALRIGAARGSVQVEPDGCVVVSCRAPDLDPRGALERTAELAGNARFAGPANARVLIAEARLGDAGVGRSLAEIRTSLAGLLDVGGDPKPLPRLSTSDLDVALDGLGWADDAIVRGEDLIELRPRVGASPCAIRATIVDGQLRLRATILREAPSGDAIYAVAEQALRLNARIKFARIALGADRVVAECLLHRELVEPTRLAHAARAVASAARHAAASLELLSEQAGVARSFARLFLQHQTAPRAAGGVHE